jgi:hypothetical protein
MVLIELFIDDDDVEDNDVDESLWLLIVWVKVGIFV